MRFPIIVHRISNLCVDVGFDQLKIMFYDYFINPIQIQLNEHAHFSCKTCITIHRRKKRKKIV